MTAPANKMALIRLDAARDQKLDAIAEAMSAELGVPVSRTAAVRRMIDLFYLPKNSVERIKDVETKSAA